MILVGTFLSIVQNFTCGREKKWIFLASYSMRVKEIKQKKSKLDGWIRRLYPRNSFHCRCCSFRVYHFSFVFCRTFFTPSSSVYTWTSGFAGGVEGCQRQNGIKFQSDTMSHAFRKWAAERVKLENFNLFLFFHTHNFLFYKLQFVVLRNSFSRHWSDKLRRHVINIDF